MRVLISIVPIAALSTGSLVLSSILQKSYLGVPITPDGFFAPLANGLVLGVLLGLWVHRCRESSRQVRLAAQRTTALNRELLNREEELRRSLEEKRVLIGEVHHRVRNNLQVLGSMISLERAGCEDTSEAVEIAYRGMLRRIEALSLAYDGLGEPGLVTELPLQGVIQGVVQRAIQYSERERSVSAAIDAGGLTLDLRLAVPFAILLSELVDLSLTRSLSSREQGRIQIELRSAGSTCECRYRDDGAGLDLLEPRDSCAEELRRQMIVELARQLGGCFELQRGEGSEGYLLRFPASAVPSCN